MKDKEIIAQSLRIYYGGGVERVDVFAFVDARDFVVSSPLSLIPTNPKKHMGENTYTAGIRVNVKSYNPQTTTPIFTTISSQHDTHMFTTTSRKLQYPFPNKKGKQRVRVVQKAREARNDCDE